MKGLFNKAIDGTILHAMVLGSWTSFVLAHRRSIRFREAVRGFEARYQFRAGSAMRSLVFHEGRITTRNGAVDSPDYELVLNDPLAVAKRIVSNPNDMIRLLMENKIDQRGNNFYLFKYGYLMGLCERYIRDLHDDVVPDFIRKRKKGADCETGPGL